MYSYKYTIAELDALRPQTDIDANEVIAKLLDQWSIKQTHELFRTLPSRIESGDMPGFLKDYMLNYGSLPEWIDLKRLERGRALFLDYGREIVLTLLTRSLPMCFVCAHGATVLATTTRLIDIPATPKYERRLLETLQFFVNVCEIDGLSPGTKSWDTLKQIRLIHATIRRFIHEKMEWPSAERGEPINQEDQLMTISAFCIEVIKGLEKIGIHFSRQEKDDWCHLWRVNGYMMGVDETYLPDDYSSFETMSERIHVSQSAKSADGLLLVQSCVDFMGALLPFRILENFSYSVFKHLNDEKYREMMGLTRTHWFWDWVMPRLMRSTLAIDERLENRSFILKLFIRGMNSWLINGILKLKLRNGKYLYLPDSLKK